MPLISRRGEFQNAVPLRPVTLVELGLKERQHLQQFIRNHHLEIAQELDVRWKVIGEEVVIGADISRRVDLLAVDADGGAVIIELKRGRGSDPEMQALRYGLLLKEWASSDFIEQHRRFNALPSVEAATADLAEFVDLPDLERLGRHASLVLFAEDFSEETLRVAEALQHHGWAVSCVKLALFESGEYWLWDFDVVFRGVRRESDSPRPTRAVAIEGPAAEVEPSEALGRIQNIPLREEFAEQIAAGVEFIPKYCRLSYRAPGGLRWTISGRRQSAYVWQRNRFPEDLRLLREINPQTSEAEEGRNLKSSVETPQQLARLISLIQQLQGDAAQSGQSV